MNVYTIEQASLKLCPVTTPNLSDGFSPCCHEVCMAWRWQPLMAGKPFLDAVKARMKTAKESHAKAAAYVGDNRAEFGLPDEPFLGYCGLAGGWK